MNMINLAQTVERCQRNWDYTPIPQKHVDEIVSVCTTMPTKNNLANYELHVSTDLEFNKSVFKISVNPDDKNTVNRNSQVYAPLLLIWTINKTLADELVKHTDFDIIDRDTAISIGISSGAAALAAANLGYKTGFCKCFILKELDKLLTNKFGVHQIPSLMLGIGMPNNKYQRTDVVINDTIVREVESNDKKIKVSQI